MEIKGLEFKCRTLILVDFIVITKNIDKFIKFSKINFEFIIH